MGTNYHTPYADTVTAFTAASMNPALAGLDKAITYAAKSLIVHCDGDITWSAGTLTWAGTIRILFNRADGQAIQNTVAASSIALADNEFAYVTLNETNDSVLTMSKASVTTGAASNFLTEGIVVLAYRNTTSDELYPVWLPYKYSVVMAAAGAVLKADYNANTILAADADDTPAALEIAEDRVVGRVSGGNIVGLTAAQIRTLIDCLDGREQAITCAADTTIDWSAGATARMTFDRDSVNMTFSNPVNGKVYRLLLIQSAGGDDTITWVTSIKWRGGSAPTLSTAGNAIDILTFVYINSAWYGDIAAAFA